MMQETIVLSPRQAVSLVQTAVFFVAGISLLSIWRMGDPDRRGETARHTSIMFLAIACFFWSLMAVLQYRQSQPSDLPTIFRTLFSTVNTAFILGATAGLEAYEESVPRLLKKLMPTFSFQHATWIVMGVFVVVGFLMSMTFMLVAGRYADCPDILLGVTTLGFVLFGLYKSFQKRGFHFLAWLSIAVVVPYILVQFTEVPWLVNFFKSHPLYNDLRWVANLSAKTMLCLLFMALIVSWLYEKVIRKAFLKIAPPHQKGEKTVFEIQLGYSLDNTVVLTEKGYLRVLEIALKSRNAGKPIRTHNLHKKSPATDDEVRQDLAEILEQTRVDPLFGRPGKGLRSLQAAPADIMIDPNIRAWTAWKNVDFAEDVFKNWEKASVFVDVGLKLTPPLNDAKKK